MRKGGNKVKEGVDQVREETNKVKGGVDQVREG